MKKEYKLKRKIAVLAAVFYLLGTAGCAPKGQELEEAENTTVPTVSGVTDTEASATPDSSTAASDAVAPAVEDEPENPTQTDTLEEDAVFFGSWYVTDYRTSSIYALSQEEIDTLLTYTVAYYEDGFFLNGTPVEAEAEVFGYDYLDYTKAEIEEQFLADLSDWWNGKTAVKGVNLYAEENGESLPIEYCFGARFFAVDSETLWIYYEGVFFQAKRAGA